MYKTEKKFPILFTLVVLLLLGMVLFACETSNEQERQITNAFTPGKSTQDAMLHTQQAEDSQTQTDTAVITPGSQPETAPLPSDQPTMMITTTQGQPIIVTQTMAATQPNQPTNVSTATKKPANTAAATTTPTKTATLTPPPTMQTGWAGEWIFYLDNGTGGYTTGTLSVTLDGRDVFGEAVINGSSYQFVGQLNTAGTSIMGDYTTETDEGWFYWVFLSDSQFGGMMDNRFAFCASRNGAERPGQCGYFVLS
jgi:hypothetical protein